MTEEDFKKIVDTLREKYLHEETSDGGLVFKVEEHHKWEDWCYCSDPVWTGYLHVYPEVKYIAFHFQSSIKTPTESNIEDITSWEFLDLYTEEEKKKAWWIVETTWKHFLSITRNVKPPYNPTYGRKSYALIPRVLDDVGDCAGTFYKEFISFMTDKIHIKVVKYGTFEFYSAKWDGQYLILNDNKRLNILDNTYTAKNYGKVLVISSKDEEYIIHL